MPVLRVKQLLKCWLFLHPQEYNGATAWCWQVCAGHLTGWVTDKPGRPLGKVGGRLIRRVVARPSAMRTGASKRDLHTTQLEQKDPLLWMS